MVEPVQGAASPKFLLGHDAFSFEVPVAIAEADIPSAGGDSIVNGNVIQMDRLRQTQCELFEILQTWRLLVA